jgi:hypothetical protein
MRGSSMGTLPVLACPLGRAGADFGGDSILTRLLTWLPLGRGARLGGDDIGGRFNIIGGIGLPWSVELTPGVVAALTGDIGR